MEPGLSSSPHSPLYTSLLVAGPRIRPLTQIHARIVISTLHRNRSLLTKLLTLIISAGYPLYANRLLPSVPNPDAFLFDSIIRASSRSTLPLHSLHFYLLMLSSSLRPSNYTFTSLLKTCADLSASDLGRILHSHVLAAGFGLDRFVQTSLVVLYSKAGNLIIARKVFNRMPDKSVVVWNALISGYEQNGRAGEAIELFYLMRKKGIEPDDATLAILLSACSQVGDLALGKWLHEHYIQGKNLRLGLVLGSSLLNMYARCGQVAKAREIFDGLEEQNAVSWTAMIAGYGMHGFAEQAMELFERMQLYGPPPNLVTFVAVLSACAHGGMVQQGREAFDSMKFDYNFIPRAEHHVCMVDLYGRAGLLDEAMKFIRDQITGEPEAAVWTALLGACKMHKNFNRAAEIATKLLALEPENPSHHVLLSNIHALAGKMEKVEEIRDFMISRGWRKKTGYSLIEINNVPYMFRMGDTSNLKTVEIYRYLEELICRIREVGYEPMTDSVLHELEEEEREVALRFHSEKLAVAFGLLSTGAGSLIKVVKNLRICGDCHLAIKFISGVTGREIVVRDKHRFHHFRYGLCSCQDYW
ncbi:pentatricopeptide repeat-containing protein At2g33760 [Phalaenopsis equestris]|uniref:pentatricopeptide repeat-containing protein At2g33760 n=1 Tax=Phalaenopsis equestris TaxID=78828 RepID=UPI0009E4EC62|nr:pentatricopeptide repeat-containing protein At2g33760 [Phalaenopsis equestris]